MSREDSEYGAGQIQVLEGLEAVRKRPAMYVGSTDARGLHHLVYEVVDNSIDEALAGYCDSIEVTVHGDGSVTVADDGRGIPVDTHEEHDRPAVEVIMTVLHAGGKFDSKSYQVSGGLHGVGVSVVNALSKDLAVEVRRDGAVWRQRFDQGAPEHELERVHDLPADEDTGTEIRFWPDTEIFETTDFAFSTLANRLRELAFLNPGAEITLTDERDGTAETFQYDGGIREFVTYLNETKDPLHDDVVFFADEAPAEEADGDIHVEVAMQATAELQGSIHAFANNINTREGGTHLTGFKTALTRVVNDYATDNDLLKDLDDTLKGEDIREGMTAVISVKHPDPQFEGQTKTKLGNSAVRGVVESAVHAGLGTYFEEHPDTAEAIISKAVEAAKARKAAKKAEELTRRKSALESTALPGKLADCQTKDPTESELFIVEGDSAGGCFTGDTEVALATGRSITFEELIEEHENGEDHYCYTVDDDGKIGVERIENTRVTREDAPLVEVTLDDGETIRCTPDHEFMLRDGSYCEAQHLDDGQSLMALYPKESDTSENERTSPEKIAIQDGGRPLKEVRNSSVASVEELDETADVYDLEVPETHNFALEAGVFVHNSAKQGRNPEFQAILPLGGKIMNVEKHRLDRILEHDEIRHMITAIGTGIGEEFDLEDARYERIILATDADVDGAHIRTLLLTFFYRHMRPLLEAGYVYATKPPLYRIRYRGNTYDVMTDAERDEVIEEECNGNPTQVQRFKGLGEMNPEQLWETTMNPQNRVLKQITIEDAAAADKMFAVLMGDAVEPRKQFIKEHAPEAEWVDI
jgi:DNA gyrase subunit B